MGLNVRVKYHSDKGDIRLVYDQSFMGGGQVEPKLWSTLLKDLLFGKIVWLWLAIFLFKKHLEIRHIITTRNNRVCLLYVEYSEQV